MNGYLPNNPGTIGWIAVALFAELAVGFAITRFGNQRFARLSGWLLVVTSLVGIERLATSEPAGVRMLAVIGALLLGMKVLVSVEERSAGRPALRPRNWFLFALLWPGMRPSTFSDVPGPPKRHWPRLLKRGALNLTAGVVLVTMACMASSTDWWALLLLLPGLSLILHFGVFRLLGGCWRTVGADCHALFRAPLQSRSLSEFWGRRWNLAFSEMTALVVFRPLKSVIGTRTATLSAFLFSGILHELAISVPVRSGYGLPFLYFSLHAVALQIEQRWNQQKTPLRDHAWRGRVWTALWLLLPLPILFHPPFLTGCVLPIIGLGTEGMSIK